MEEFKKILQSFKIKNTLNPHIWKKTNDGDYVIYDEVRTKLLEIANDFIDSLGVDIVISDIIFTGSLCNFNWSTYSDIDLHLIVDYSQFDEEQETLYDKLFFLRKTIYNKNHDIRIYGYDVELYIENEKDIRKVESIGKYSILENEWIIKPSKESKKIDFKGVQIKSKRWMKMIDDIIDNTKKETYDEAKIMIDKFNDKLGKFRQSGLDKGGEYSEENLVFKVLRRNGYLDKIRSIKDKLADIELSLKEQKQQ